MTKDYQLDVKLTDVASGTDVFTENYKIALRQEFVDSKEPK